MIKQRKPTSGSRVAIFAENPGRAQVCVALAEQHQWSIVATRTADDTVKDAWSAVLDAALRGDAAIVLVPALSALGTADAQDQRLADLSVRRLGLFDADAGQTVPLPGAA